MEELVFTGVPLWQWSIAMFILSTVFWLLVGLIVGIILHRRKGLNINPKELSELSPHTKNLLRRHKDKILAVLDGRR